MLVGGLRGIATRLARLPELLRRRTSSGVYRPEIDGLRFIAIAIVVAGHLAERALRFGTGTAGPVSGVIALIAHPSSGVLLFFSISGFIIFHQLQRGGKATIGWGQFGHYLKRRALRIEPPYLLLLIATYVLIQYGAMTPPRSVRFDAEPRSLTASLIASLLYSHSWFYGTLPRLFPPGWSLEVEIQFYLIAPALAAMYYAVREPRRPWAGLVGMAASLILAIGVAQLWRVGRLTILFHLPFFWLGAVIASHRSAIVDRLRQAPPALAAGAAWGGLAIFMLTGTSEGGGASHDMVRFVLELSGAALMLLGTLHPSNSFRSFCSLGWISLIGGACYSIYLTHLQVLQVVAAAWNHLFAGAAVETTFLVLLVVGLPAVLAAGLTFYAAIERFFMREDWPSLVGGLFRRTRATVSS